MTGISSRARCHDSSSRRTEQIIIITTWLTGQHDKERIMMKTTKIFSMLAAGLLVFALLTSGGCTDDDENERVEKCERDDTIRRGEYVLVNDGGAQAYTLCIFDDPKTQTFGWTWAEIVPAPPKSSTTIRAYLFYGQPDHYNIPPALWESGSTTPDLPVKVKDLASFTITYDVDVFTTSDYALGVSTNNYGCRVGMCWGAFLSIVLDSSGYDPPTAAYFQEQMTIRGEAYDFYLNRNGGYPVYEFIKVIPSRVGTLDLYALLKYLDEKSYGGEFPSIFFLNFW